MGAIKLKQGGGYEEFWIINNLVILYLMICIKCIQSLDLKYSVIFLFFRFLLSLYNFRWLDKVFSLNMFEFIFGPIHGLARLLRYECHTKYVRGEIPWYLHTIRYYLLYSFNNYNYCFGKKNVSLDFKRF